MNDFFSSFDYLFVAHKQQYNNDWQKKTLQNVSLGEYHNTIKSYLLNFQFSNSLQMLLFQKKILQINSFVKFID